jgi:hypothetical protein
MLARLKNISNQARKGELYGVLMVNHPIISGLFFAILVCFACSMQAEEFFGLKNQTDNYDIVISADIRSPGQQQIIAGGRVSPKITVPNTVSNFVTCILAKNAADIESCYARSSPFYTAGLTTFAYLQNVETLDVLSELKWGRFRSYLIEYKAKDRKFKHSDVLTFECVNNRCLAVNNLANQRLGDHSTGIFDILTAIFDVHKNGNLIPVLPSQIQYSKVAILGDDSNINLYLRFHKPEAISLQLNDLTTALRQCDEKLCQRQQYFDLMSSMLGAGFEELIHPYIQANVKEVSFAGFLEQDHLIEKLKLSSQCEAHSMIHTGPNALHTFKCNIATGYSYFSFNVAGKDPDIQQLNYPAAILISSKAVATAIHQINAKKSMISNINGVSEKPGISIQNLSVHSGLI